MEAKPDRRAPSPQPSPRRGEGVNGPAPMIRMDLMSVRLGISPKAPPVIVEM